MAWIDFPETWHAWIPNISGDICIHFNSVFSSESEKFPSISDFGNFDVFDGDVKIIWENNSRLKVNYCLLYLAEVGAYKLNVINWDPQGLFSYIIQFDDELTLTYDGYVEQYRAMGYTNPEDEVDIIFRELKEKISNTVYYAIKNFYHNHTHHNKDHDFILKPVKAIDKQEALDKINNMYLQKATYNLTELSKFIHTKKIKRFLKSIWSTNWAQQIVMYGIGEMAYAKTIIPKNSLKWEKFISVYKNISNFINSTHTFYNAWLVFILTLLCAVFAALAIFYPNSKTKKVEITQPSAKREIPLLKTQKIITTFYKDH